MIMISVLSSIAHDEVIFCGLSRESRKYTSTQACKQVIKMHIICKYTGIHKEK